MGPTTVRVAERPGLPLLGGATMIIDGTAHLIGPEGTDTVSAGGLGFAVGKPLPQEGALLVTADGHRVVARFSSRLWLLHQAELHIDDLEPVRVPFLQ
jgi:hypothetical protein